MADYQDAKGNKRPLDSKGWPHGTEKWADTSFGAKDHASFQHPTQHNLSPVEGEHEMSQDRHGGTFARHPG